MRITTTMLNETAKRTGIPVNQPNLLGYLNKTQNSGNTLLDSLYQSQKASRALPSDSRKLQKAADQLWEAADKLTGTGEHSLFAEAKASGEKDKLYNGVKNFVDSYNATLSETEKNASPLQMYYGQMLQEAAGADSKALENLGITVGKDGKMSIDSGKFNSASIEEIEKTFGETGTLTQKVSFVAGRISDYAQANTQSTYSQYNSYGNMDFGGLYAQLMSKFHLYG